MIGLVELAQRYVSLSAELEETRSAMRAALMNGSDRYPTKAGSSGPPNKGTDRERVLAQSKEADERVLALLREKPMRPSEIVRATQGKLSTMRERLRRLRKRGVVEPAKDGWRLTLRVNDGVRSQKVAGKRCGWGSRTRPRIGPTIEHYWVERPQQHR
jgi:hypothetical protein